MSSALQKAMDGQEVSEKQAKSALGAAVDRITNLKKKAEDMKETVTGAATEFLKTGITQSTLFTASVAKGALGDKYLRPGGVVDVRPVTAGVLGLYSIYDLLMNDGKYGGAYALAGANGIGGSWTAEMGIAAGQGMQKMWEKPQDVQVGSEGQTRQNADGKTEVFKAGQWQLAGAIGPERKISLLPTRSKAKARARRDDEYED